LLLVAPLAVFEAVGMLKKVDTEKRLLYIRANGQDRTVPIDKDVRVLGADGKPLPDGLKSKELKDGAEVTVTVDRTDAGPIIKAIRLGKPAAARAANDTGKPSVGLKPLTEMTADDRYKGEDGGLYVGGKNEPPAEHQKAAAWETARIRPVDTDGKPAADGSIGRGRRTAWSGSGPTWRATALT